MDGKEQEREHCWVLQGLWKELSWPHGGALKVFCCPHLDLLSIALSQWPGILVNTEE